MHRVIGVDPSLSATGLAVVDFDDGRVLDWTCIWNPKLPKKRRGPESYELIRRAGALFDGVKAFLHEHPYPIAVEGLSGGSYGQSGVGANFGLGVGYGVVLAACASLDRTPVPIMGSVVAKRMGAMGLKTKAEKTAKVWESCQMFFSSFPDPLSSKAKQESVVDATAVCIASLSTNILEESHAEHT